MQKEMSRKPQIISGCFTFWQKYSFFFFFFQISERPMRLGGRARRRRGHRAARRPARGAAAWPSWWRPSAPRAGRRPRWLRLPAASSLLSPTSRATYVWPAHPPSGSPKKQRQQQKHCRPPPGFKRSRAEQCRTPGGGASADWSPSLPKKSTAMEMLECNGFRCICIFFGSSSTVNALRGKLIATCVRI